MCSSDLRWVAKAKGIWPATTDRQVAEAKMLEEGDIGPEVEALQKRLTELGYPVGLVDGRWSILTSRALRNFQAEHGLVVDGKLGPRTKDALATSAPADLGERREITAEDLAERGSSTVTEGQKVELGGKVTAFATGAAGVVTVGKQVADAADQARSLSDQAMDFLAWLTTPAGLGFLALIVASLLAWRIAVWGARIVSARVNDARAGVHLGR